MNKTLHGKTALVTGASRGIGAAIALRLAQEGADVLLHYGSGVEEVKQVAARIEALGRQARLVQADLAAAEGPAHLASQLGDVALDILVNNAGVAPFAAIEDTTPEVFDRLAAINMRSLFFVTQHALKHLRDGGRIINLSSAVSRVAFPGIPAYAATKGFVDVLTLQLAAALAPRSITVNAVAPGAIDTRMSAWIHDTGGRDMLGQMQALPGVGQPEQVAGVVAFLAGPDGAWTTGRTIDVSGGTKL